MQQTSWETNPFWASQEIPKILRNLKVHYYIYKCPPPVPSLCQINWVHSPPSHYLKIHLNVILPSTPGSFKWTVSSDFPTKNHPVYTSSLPHTYYIPCPSHSSWVYLLNNILWGVQVIKLLIISFLSSPITSSLLDSNFLLSAIFSNFVSLHSSLNVSDQVSHPYKITDKIIVLYMNTSYW